MARLFPDDIPYLEETNKRNNTLFYSENPLESIADLLKFFEKYLDSIQIYNKVVQGTPTDMHRIDIKMILSMVKDLQTMLDI